MFRIAWIVSVVMVSTLGHAQEKIFSGPQPGEKVASFKARGVFATEAGKEIDLIKTANGKPLLLVFVHEANRPSIALTRTLMNYAVTRGKDLTSATIWLTDDMADAETQLKRMQHALAKDSLIAISPDGKEGPGAYGLNRNVTLTILVAKENKVTANFALVQPSIASDLPKILKEVVAVAGGTVPKLEDLPDMKQSREKMTGNANVEEGIAQLRRLIQLKAKPEEVEEAAKKIEALFQKDVSVKQDIGRRAATIVNGGKVENYGTSKAQDYLRKWAKEFEKLPKKDEKR
jgi:hypothetical protein